MKYLYFLIPAIFFLMLGIPTADAALSGKCSVEPSRDLVPGQEVQWSIEPSGGSAVYEYEWTGSEGLSSGSRSPSIAYRTEGSKWAQVTIYSGDERRTVDCPRVQVIYPPLRGSCAVNTSASNERIRVRWSTDVAGGNGVYSYSWSGSEGLSGNASSVEKLYTRGGRKDAAVTIFSGGESIHLSCNTTIPSIDDLEADPISFGCEVQSDSYTTERDLVWYALYSGNRSGWERGLAYEWKANDIRRYTKRLSIEYEDPGYKRGNLTTSDEEKEGLLITQSSCQVYIVDEDTLPEQEVDYEKIERADKEYEGSDLFARNVAKYRDRIQNGKSGCFIATAAYGSYLEPEVETLREFRDEQMQQSAFGRALVRSYYFASPPLASIIEKSDVLRFSARIALSPIVAVVKMLN